MALDQMILENLRRQAEIDQEVEKDIDSAFKGLSLDEIMANPSAALQVFAEDVAQAVIDRHATKYIAEGVRFADEVLKSGEKLEFNADPEDNPSKEEISGDGNGKS